MVVISTSMKFEVVEDDGKEGEVLDWDCYSVSLLDVGMDWTRPFHLLTSKAEDITRFVMQTYKHFGRQS